MDDGRFPHRPVTSFIKDACSITNLGGKNCFNTEGAKWLHQPHQPGPVISGTVRACVCVRVSVCESVRM